MATSYDNNDWLDTIAQVNAVSPKPNYDGISQAGSSGSATSPMMFGLSPGQTNKQFDASYGKATAGYDPFPGDHSAIDRETDLYKTIPGTYDRTDTLAALGATRQANLLGGEQAANTAATAFQESSIPGSASGVGASMLRAQALLPYLQQDTSAAAGERGIVDSAKSDALSASMALANNIADSTQKYTDSLALYNTNKANFGLQYATNKTDTALKASQSNVSNQLSYEQSQAALAEQARQANLSAALRTQDANTQANETGNAQTMQADQAVLAGKAPTGTWQTDNSGNVISGQADYNAYQQYLKNRNSATGSLVAHG